MVKPATVTQRRQLGVETTAGTPVEANRIVEGMTLTPNVEAETEAFTPDGSKHAAAVVKHREHATLELTGIPCYRALAYGFASIVGNRTTEQLATGVFAHQFTTAARRCDSLATFTVEAGQACGSDGALRATYAQLAEMSLELSKAGSTAELDGTGFARAVERGRTLSGNTRQALTVAGASGGTFRLQYTNAVTEEVAQSFDISNHVTLNPDPQGTTELTFEASEVSWPSGGDIRLTFQLATTNGFDEGAVQVTVPAGTVNGSLAQQFEDELLNQGMLGRYNVQSFDESGVQGLVFTHQIDSVDQDINLTAEHISAGYPQTDPIDYDATAADVQQQLESLVGSGNVLATGGPLGQDTVLIEFVGTYTQTDVATLGVVNETDGNIDVNTVNTGQEPQTVGVVPLTAEHVSVYADSSHQELGSTNLGRITAVNLEISDRAEPAFYLDGSATFTELLEQLAEFQLETTVAADGDGIDLGVGAIQRGDTRYFRVRAVGPSIDSDHSFQLTIDAAAQVEEVQEFSDEDGTYAITYTWRIVHSHDWGQAIEVTLVNDVEEL